MIDAPNISQTIRRGALWALVLAALLSLALAANASAAVEWKLTSQHGPTNMAPGGAGQYALIAQNIGDSVANSDTDEDSLPDIPQTTIVETLPAGVIATGFSGKGFFGEDLWDCASPSGFPSAPGETVSCAYRDYAVPIPPQPVGPGSNPNRRGIVQTLFIDVEVEAGAAPGSFDSVAEISGGGTSAVTTVIDPTMVSLVPAGFGLLADGGFLADAFEGSSEAATPVRQAGAHPFEARFNLRFNLKHNSGPYGSFTEPDEHVHRITTDLPAGFLGNPEAAAKCAHQELLLAFVVTGICPAASQVGTVDLFLNNFSMIHTEGNANGTQNLPVFNMVPPEGALAAVAFLFQGYPTYIVASLDPAHGYRVRTTVSHTIELYPVRAVDLSLWGVPADPAHDDLRFNATPAGGGFPYFGTPAGVLRKPFLTLPSDCSKPGQIEISINSWRDPDVFKRYASDPATPTGCNQLDFSPSIEARPTTNLADTPAGLEVNLHVPQNEDPDGLSEALLRNATVTLPQGLTVNAASAAGLSACSPEQIGLTTPVGEADAVFDGAPQRCPDGAKLGTVQLETPVLDHPLGGSVYLATQNENPFGSLLALYLVIEDPRTGVVVKLPGRVDANQATGQLSTTFTENPQLPFEDLEVSLFQGPRAALKTPATCGTHTTTTDLRSWSAPEVADANPSSSFELTGGPSGGACLPGGAAAPNKPSFSAGTMDPTAKAFTPFVLKLARADGTQQLAAIDTLLPQGLTAKLAGTTYCPEAALSAASAKSGEAEQGAPSCPASSHLGTVDVGAGAGSTPLHVQGQAYLAGPYKGAPLSLAVITPAVAGPFDLGVVLVRVALQVNPETAQVHAVSDELPTILQGIPLNVRSIALKMDRPQFILNPTSCDPMSIEASALTLFGQSASLTNPFQVGECNKLAFKPKLSMRFFGPTHRSAHPRLRAELRARPGDANIARAQVTLPTTELLAQSHIRTICTRVRYAARNCPAKSIYGYAKAWTPLLDQPLEGPVYLRSSNNPLPDLVAFLDGQLHVDLIGRIDAKNARIRNTFELVPDAPVSKFVLTMRGGGKGLLVNNTDLCKAKPRLDATFEAQNGKVAELKPLVRADCGTKGRKGKRKGGKR